MHITQRGVNRCAIFIDDRDRLRFLDLLRSASTEYGVAIHAYVLMGNHVHLLMSAPGAGDVGMAIRKTGQRYVQYFNAKHSRTGTLWQGRFKSCLVDSETYLLRVIRYIELNPVRAALAAIPHEFRWSSARAHLGLCEDPMLSVHPVVLGLGASAGERIKWYGQWLAESVAEEESSRIRAYLAQERALGEPTFQQLVERTLNRPAVLVRPGRSPKATTIV